VDGKGQVYAVYHEKHGVYAGFAMQLAGAMRAANDLDLDLQKLQRTLHFAGGSGRA
jgi:hypothetical protein